eukprot:gnl/TRDRNA2_/TRDRNA2_189576_c0_seq1.p1 gnl/TRDRNA2_/TRDRNA2_189576_c0~~gnl/TRDRNA2_/TRDRNA2_189576_c0_seq1.p1  ORF type:complete len:344 (+),score=120.02 gnl/TRDRNA2_/TRDRNA2_189576_c0_seq1:130-1161(+)
MSADPALAELLKAKIAEIEKKDADQSAKTQKAQKGKAKLAMKNKTKEVKSLLSNTDMSDTEKVKILLEKLKQEHKEANANILSCQEQNADIQASERERDISQAELNRAVGVKDKLDSLCKQLQQQTQALVDERRRLTDAERLRRQELADEFQNTIGDVKKKMDAQANERARLAKENEDLRNKFKQFFDQYDKRERELVEQQKERETEVQSFESKLAEHAQRYKQQVAHEQVAQRENDDLLNTDQTLRGQLQTYTAKFKNFQDALSKSDKVLGQYKRQRNRMQQKVAVLEKENKELQVRNGKRLATVSKERDNALKEKEDQQVLCKRLQAERQELLDEIAKLES